MAESFENQRKYIVTLLFVSYTYVIMVHAKITTKESILITKTPCEINLELSLLTSKNLMESVHYLSIKL